MHRDHLIYIHHIHDWIIKINRYTATISMDDFLKNSLIHDAVIRNFEIIGEATKKLSPEFRAKYGEIEWKRIAGLRDKLIHDYLGVDLEALWAVIMNMLPEFEQQIQEIIGLENENLQS